MENKFPIRVLEEVAGLGSGGIETFLINIYRNIDTSLIQFDFILSHDWGIGLYEDEIKRRGGRIFYLPEGPRQWWAFYIFLKKHKEYKIVHSHRGAFGSFYLFVAWLAGVKYRILHSHQASDNKWAKSLSVKLLRPFVIAVSSHRFGCGVEAGKWAFGKFRHSVFNNSIDVGSFQCIEKRSQVRTMLNISDNCVLYAHVGRFDTPKNHFFLINVFNEISQRQEQSRLLLIGDGEMLDVVKKRVIDLNLNDRVTFLSRRKDVNELLQAVDFVLFPSLFEGFSMAQVEMQAAGLRVLCSDTIDPKINITGEIYFKSLNDGPISWAEEAIRLSDYVRKSVDVSNLYKAGYDIKSNAKRMQDFYLQLVEKV